MAQQRFRALTTYSDPLFSQNVRLAEFIEDLGRAFHRKINLITTTNDKLIITIDADIPNADGLGDLPFFDPAYYGVERI